MATNNEVMTAALRKLNVIAQGQSINGEQGLILLPIMNDMIEEWTEREVEFGYFAQSDATETCPIPKWAEKAVKANLAVACASSFSAPIPPDVAIEANETFKVIQRKCIEEKLKQLDMSHLPIGSGSLGATRDITR
jgi:hypothetical protein